MSRFLQQSAFADPIPAEVIDRPTPVPRPGEVLVRVRAAGLNPVDWKLAISPGAAEAFGLTLPTGLGNDLAGVVEAIGPDVTGFAVGDRVYGGARGAAIADHAIVPASSLRLTPDGLSDEVAGSVQIAARTAEAAVTAVALEPGETVLIGGAAGGVGVLAVQLAVRAGATVIATASERNHEFLASLGAVPTTYGEGLADRVRALAPDGVDAAIDLQGVETAEAAVSLGVDPGRISTIAAGASGPEGTVATGGNNASAGALEEIAQQLADGELQLPIQQTFPLDEALDALALLREGHVRGKLVVTP
ncbi:MAG: NADP-dependent oxidoreductase [Microbacterium sp.]